MRYRSRRLAALAVTVVGFAAACGDQSAAPDHGAYSVRPIATDYDDTASRSRGILVESLRLGEHLLIAEEVDPDLSISRGGGVIADHGGVDGLLSAVQMAALRPFDVLGAFGAIAGNDQLHNEAVDKSLTISLVALPSEESAVAAAAAMAAADFGANAENAPLAVPEHPAALTHWRPGVPTVGSWLVWKNLVIRVFAKVAEPRPEALVDLLTRTYRAQLAELATFTPTPAAELATAQIDRDGLLTRLVATGDPTPDRKEFAVYGPRAFALLLDRPLMRSRMFDEHRVRAIAVSHNKILYHTESPTAAESFDAAIQTGQAEEYVTMRGVPATADVSCFRALRPDLRLVQARRFTCLIRHDEFVARVYSNQELDARQLAAAQYTLLADSQGT
ncbi:DUF7373 family lipoprotein [Nocardia neocaledoniensis]|uniref:DUF7373 family lipoprotein n=1 Tax=Nocardia neocaledoniensis TaxID=236511 RepID=UPI002456F633|nr:hypothetical protein [Nocardia neocaledoniensis]